MRTLFVKIFLWFWLAMALVWSAFLLPAHRQQREEIAAYWQAYTNQRLELSGRAALYVVRRYGPERIDDFVDSLAPSAAPFPYVFDEDLQEVTGRQPEPLFREVARRALSGEDIRERHEGLGLVVAHAFDAVAGRRGSRHRVQLVAVQALPRPEGLASPPGIQAFRWAAVLLTSGLVCWGLAYYLTRPVKRLRDATHRLAAGDLEARVGEIGRRKDELAALGRDFDRMAERLEELLTSQRQLLTDISHELRSPLARLYVALGLARRREGDSREDALERIEREAERLNELIGQLLALSRMEAGDAGEPDTVELHVLLEEVVADADYEARARDRRVELEQLDPVVLEGHEELLRRAVENVLRNAVRHTEAGTTVRVALVVEGAGVRLRVRDFGPGVPEAELDKLFRPFYRPDRSRDRGGGGVGLGLAIARRAVRLHGGDIRARNHDDGLEVEVELPGAGPPTTG
ncbi:MAG: ATP-binding protein [Acidobacteriota bacterium]